MDNGTYATIHSKLDTIIKEGKVIKAWIDIAPGASVRIRGTIFAYTLNDVHKIEIRGNDASMFCNRECLQWVSYDNGFLLIDTQT